MSTRNTVYRNGVIHIFIETQNNNLEIETPDKIFTIHEGEIESFTKELQEKVKHIIDNKNKRK